MKIYVDIPIFSSSTQAIGNATGVVEVARPPEVREPLAWPKSDSTRSRFFELLLFSPVVAISSSESKDAEMTALLDGVVLDGAQELPDLIDYLRCEYGIVYVGY